MTKEDFDCLSLFCLLVWEGAISITLTVHQSFWNWILVRGGGAFIKPPPSLTQQYRLFGLHKLRLRPGCLPYGMFKYYLIMVIGKLYIVFIPLKYHRTENNPPQCYSRRKEVRRRLVCRTAAPSSGHMCPLRSNWGKLKLVGTLTGIKRIDIIDSTETKWWIETIQMPPSWSENTSSSSGCKFN